MSRPFPYLSYEESFSFPDPDTATPEGIVGTGGNLSPGMLLSAYSQGIFPWFSDDEPLLWWSPDPRFVIFPEDVHLPASMRKIFRKNTFTFSFDTCFSRVISLCSAVPRKGQGGTWITDDMIEAYISLHELGYAHSVEAYKDGELAGGLYGISLGSLYFGESMFCLSPNASKAAFFVMATTLTHAGFILFDSQVQTNHVARLGGKNIPRSLYLDLLKQGLSMKTLRGNWGEILTPLIPDD